MNQTPLARQSFYGWWVVGAVGVAGPPLAGWIFDTQSNLEVTWILCLLVTLAAVPLVLAIGPRQACLSAAAKAAR